MKCRIYSRTIKEFKNWVEWFFLKRGISGQWYLVPLSEPLASHRQFHFSKGKIFLWVRGFPRQPRGLGMQSPSSLEVSEYSLATGT